MVLGCGVPALAALAVVSVYILINYSEALRSQDMLGSLSNAIAVIKIAKSGKLLWLWYKP